MSIRTPLILAVAAAASLSVAGCSGDGQSETAQAGSAAASTTSTQPVGAGNSGPVGASHQVTVDGAAATITVGDELHRTVDEFVAPEIVVPVTVDVRRGELVVDGSRWNLVTASGKRIDGSGAGLSDGLGSEPMTGRVQGRIGFSDPGLDEKVSIARIEFYGSPWKTGEPAARWVFTPALQVSEIPSGGPR